MCVCTFCTVQSVTMPSTQVAFVQTSSKALNYLRPSKNSWLTEWRNVLPLIAGELCSQASLPELAIALYATVAPYIIILVVLQLVVLMVEWSFGTLRLEAWHSVISHTGRPVWAQCTVRSPSAARVDSLLQCCCDFCGMVQRWTTVAVWVARQNSVSVGPSRQQAGVVFATFCSCIDLHKVLATFLTPASLVFALGELISSLLLPIAFTVN